MIVMETSNFASTYQPGTQRVDIWARWPDKPPLIWCKIDMLRKVFWDWSELNAPKPDTKTPKNQQVEKTGNAYPQPWQRSHPWGFRVSYEWHVVHSHLRYKRYENENEQLNTAKADRRMPCPTNHDPITLHALISAGKILIYAN